MTLQRWRAVLGYGGLVPFVSLALLLSYSNRLGLIMIAAGLVLAWLLDRFVLFKAEREADWLADFMRLRARLSAVAVLCLLTTLASPASA